MHELILFITGIVVGGMNAIAGGGMLIGFPVLVATGMSPIIANATSSLITLPGQIGSAYGYRNYIRRTPRKYFILVIPCIIGGIIGTHLLKQTDPEKFASLVPVLVLFAVLLFAYQPYLHHVLHKHMHGPRRYRQRLRPLVLICIAMTPTAIYGGYFGAGFGFIMLAFLGFTKLHEMHQINALKNVMATGLVVTCLISLAGTHLIDWQHGSFMAAGSLIGGYMGAHFAQKIPSHTIRVAIIVVGISTSGLLMIQQGTI